MNQKYILLVWPLILLYLGGCSAKPATPAINVPRNIVIAISPCLPTGQEKTELATISWAMHLSKCEVSVYDALRGDKITEFDVPAVEYFREAAVSQKIGEPLQKWIAWARASRTNANIGLSGSGAVNLPKLLEHLAQDHCMPEHLIIIGSPIARFPANPDYDFAEPHFRIPRDGCIAKNSESPFSCKGSEHSLSGTHIYYLYPNISTEAWPMGYEAKLNLFYGKLFASRSGNLMVFTPDLETGFKLVTSGAKSTFNEFKLSADEPDGMSDAVAPHPFTPTIVRPSTVVPPIIRTNAAPTPKSKSEYAWVGIPHGSRETWIKIPVQSDSAQPIDTRTNSTGTLMDNHVHPQIASNDNVLPAHGLGIASESEVVISIRYRTEMAADVDIFLRPFADAREICFREPDTAMGAYTYSFDIKTGEHVKSIKLPSGCDPEKATCWLNYKTGKGLISGEVFWSGKSALKERPFCFRSLEGGDADYHRDFTRKKSGCWLNTNLLDLMANGDPWH